MIVGALKGFVLGVVLPVGYFLPVTTKPAHIPLAGITGPDDVKFGEVLVFMEITQLFAALHEAELNAAADESAHKNLK